MARILIIEDEPDLRQVVRYNLQQDGHQVFAAAAGREGLQLARDRQPEVILLDLMLPDLSGVEVCRALKQDPTTRGIPVIFVTAKGEEIDRIVGFELGADDYVVKPFNLRELSLRISALLKRAAPAPSEAPVIFGALRVDRSAHRVRVDDAEVELTSLELRLLLTLYDRRNRVQSRTQLLQDVWGISADVTTRTVDTHIKRLREKLGRAGDYIETVRGTGYRFAERPDGGSS